MARYAMVTKVGGDMTDWAIVLIAMLFIGALTLQMIVPG